MILYTEAQLKQAYAHYCRKLPLFLPLPTLEEFRLIFEDGLELNELEEWLNNDNK
jgi:hypothetical protein